MLSEFVLDDLRSGVRMLLKYPTLSIVAIVAMFRFKIGMPATLALCAALGVALHLAGLKP